MDACCYRRWVAFFAAVVVNGLSTGCSSSESEPSPGQPACAEAPRSTLRRLTRTEYNNTVRDLLGTSLAPADGFPPEEVTGGFNNNATVLTVSPLLAEKYMEAAEALAAEAVQKLPALLPVRSGRNRRRGLRAAVRRALRTSRLPAPARWPRKSSGCCRLMPRVESRRRFKRVSSW